MAGKIIGAIVGGLALWLLSWSTSEGAVRGRVWRPIIRRPACSGGNCGQAVTVEAADVAEAEEIRTGLVTPDAPLYAVALRKCHEQIRAGWCGHYSSCPAGCWEGASMWPNGPDYSITRACHWGQREPVAIACVRARGMYWACVLYR